MTDRYRRVGLRDHMLGLGLCTAYVALLLTTAPELGMSRDEGFYVTAVEHYAPWFERLAEDPDAALTREVVDRHWHYNSEHPSLFKSLFALSYLAHRSWDLFPHESTAYRFPGMVSAGLLLWLIYIFGARAFGRQAGAFAALAFALMPRIFYHSHLDCFDVPITLMTTWVTYCYWRSLSDARWALMTGVAYGLALETKHNAWLLPGILLVHFVIVVLTELRARRMGGPKRARLTPWWLLAIIALGPPIFVGLWPWMWFDTAQRFGNYAGFHLNHEYYNMAYFGVNYFKPPFPMSYAWVMTAFTVPLATLALALTGIGTRLRALLPPGLMERLWPHGRVAPDPSRTDVLMFGCALAPLVVITMPWTPIFGGTKHWFPAYPFVALFAGIAFVGVGRAVRRAIGELPLAKYGARLAAGVVLLAPALIETVHSHPFGLSHYTFLAGGVPGAADYGMNRQFWGFTTGSLTDWFNARMPDGGSVWICDTTWTAWQMLQRDGRLQPNIRAASDLVSADYAIVHHEHHFVEVDYQIWAAYGSVRPVHVLTYDGVPIISVYENPRRR